MLTETAIAIFLLVCPAFFSTVNLHNILIIHKRRSDAEVYTEVKLPSDLIVSLAAIGTFTYFLEISTYMFLVFTNLFSVLYDSIHYFQLPFAFCMRILGVILTFLGFVLSIWSVIARDKYATSWNMPHNHKLVTWGPYHYVRHPSYLGYFLMFFGLFSLWSTFFSLILMVAIPGYYRVAVMEEKLLTQRFGHEYVEYQRKTGQFIPRLR